MKYFYFEQSIAEYLRAQQKGGKIAFSIIGVIALISLYFSPSVSWSATIVVTAFILFALSKENKIYKEIKQLPQDEKWVISLIDSKLSWSSPESIKNILADTSFEIDISTIKVIQSTKRFADSDLEYRLALKDGSFVKIKTNSHIDLNEFIQALAEREINHKEISNFRS